MEDSVKEELMEFEGGEAMVMSTLLTYSEDEGFLPNMPGLTKIFGDINWISKETDQFAYQAERNDEERETKEMEKMLEDLKKEEEMVMPKVTIAGARRIDIDPVVKNIPDDAEKIVDFYEAAASNALGIPMDFKDYKNISIDNPKFEEQDEILRKEYSKILETPAPSHPIFLKFFKMKEKLLREFKGKSNLIWGASQTDEKLCKLYPQHEFDFCVYERGDTILPSRGFSPFELPDKRYDTIFYFFSFSEDIPSEYILRKRFLEIRSMLADGGEAVIIDSLPDYFYAKSEFKTLSMRKDAQYPECVLEMGIGKTYRQNHIPPGDMHRVAESCGYTVLGMETMGRSGEKFINSYAIYRLSNKRIIESGTTKLPWVEAEKKDIDECLGEAISDHLRIGNWRQGRLLKVNDLGSSASGDWMYAHKLDGKACVILWHKHFLYLLSRENDKIYRRNAFKTHTGNRPMAIYVENCGEFTMNQSTYFKLVCIDLGVDHFWESRYQMLKEVCFELGLNYNPYRYLDDTQARANISLALGKRSIWIGDGDDKFNVSCDGLVFIRRRAKFEDQVKFFKFVKTIDVIREAVQNWDGKEHLSKSQIVECTIDFKYIRDRNKKFPNTREQVRDICENMLEVTDLLNYVQSYETSNEFVVELGDIFIGNRFSTADESRVDMLVATYPHPLVWTGAAPAEYLRAVRYRHLKIKLNMYGGTDYISNLINKIIESDTFKKLMKRKPLSPDSPLKLSKFVT